MCWDLMFAFSVMPAALLLVCVFSSDLDSAGETGIRNPIRLFSPFLLEPEMLAEIEHFVHYQPEVVQVTALGKRLLFCRVLIV